MKQETGFDPIEQVERLYFADHIVAMEGQFGAVEQWAKMGGGFVETLTAPGVRVFVGEENHEAFAI
ncbi:MAG: hypothetical protein KC620_25915, partial [Myxococcales bacterium]|nr:hypothetical protein [Myxococcales bacterium]